MLIFIIKRVIVKFYFISKYNRLNQNKYPMTIKINYRPEIDGLRAVAVL